MSDQPRRRKDTLKPVGAGEPQPPVPGTVKPTEADKDAAERAWDAAGTGLSGILGATVED